MAKKIFLCILVFILNARPLSAGIGQNSLELFIAAAGLQSLWQMWTTNPSLQRELGSFEDLIADSQGVLFAQGRPLLTIRFQDGSEFPISHCDVADLREHFPTIDNILGDLDFVSDFGVNHGTFSAAHLSLPISSLILGHNGVTRDLSGPQLVTLIRDLTVLGADGVLYNIRNRLLPLLVLEIFKLSRPLTGTFIYSNEGQPIDIQSELGTFLDTGHTLSGGAYVALGSERGALAAWMFQPSEIILADYDGIVVAFNMINIAILAMSTSVDDYRSLRLDASYDVWRRRSVEALENISDPELRRYLSALSDSRVWLWWYEHVRNGARPFQILHENNSEYFRGVNYLHNEDRWNYLHAMALAGNLRAQLLDLRDETSLREFYRRLRDRGVQISVFDLSNVWWSRYLTQAQLNQIEQLAKEYKLLSAHEQASSAFLLSDTQDSPQTVDIQTWHYLLVPVQRDQNALNYSIIKAMFMIKKFTDKL